MTWQDDLDEVRQRLAELDAARAVESASSAVATWRTVDAHSAFFLPLPLVAQERPSLAGAWWRGDRADPTGTERLGLDDRGRPLVQILMPGLIDHASRLWWWDDDGSFVEISFTTLGPEVRRARVLDGRIAHVAMASADGDGVQLLTWRNGEAVRADEARTDVAIACVADFGGDGVVRREQVEHSGDLATGLVRAAALEPREVIWDGRVERPEPWPDDPQALVEPLAGALDAALRAAARDARIEAPFVLEVRPGRDAVFPPWARLAPAKWRDHMRRYSRTENAAIENLYRGEERGEVAHLKLVEYLDADALRACRTVSGAARAVSREAGLVESEVGDRGARGRVPATRTSSASCGPCPPLRR